MTTRIEDYALIGDCKTAALIHRDGTVAWFCTPRFDSPAMFASMLGDCENGGWTLAPTVPVTTTRRYIESSMVLETTHESADGGKVRVIDGLDSYSETPHLLRRVICDSGSVPMRSEIRIRFDYGRIVPWVHRVGPALVAIAGGEAAVMYADVDLAGERNATVSTFTVAQGESVAFELTWFASYDPIPGPTDVTNALRRTEVGWRNWLRACAYVGPYGAQVTRSLLTLRALADARTGAIVAAPTTSLPERIGGVRNWDYRYCWLRDATFVLVALLNAGYEEEAFAWRAWLLRAVAGDPGELQIMYGLRGQRRVPEFEIDWLSGFGGSKPVRVGNAAAGQFQLDVFGEVVDVMYQAHRAGLPPGADEWSLTTKIVEAIENKWMLPDRGLWEIRGEDRHFVHSKVLAWVALDRVVSLVERFGLEGPIERWRALRAQIHADVCNRGFDPVRNTFTQSYGSNELDAATLLMPLVGFLPAEDPRVIGTIKAVEDELLVNGFVERYSQGNTATDGLPVGEGAFYACGFWLADAYMTQGRYEDARVLFERLCGTANDVGLLSEEYDVVLKQQVGNYPQAFSHVGLINTAYNLARGAEMQKRSEHGVVGTSP